MRRSARRWDAWRRFADVGDLGHFIISRELFKWLSVRENSKEHTSHFPQHGFLTQCTRLAHELAAMIKLLKSLFRVLMPTRRGDELYVERGGGFFWQHDLKRHLAMLRSGELRTWLEHDGIKVETTHETIERLERLLRSGPG
jgi:hypothetical protein